MVFQNYALFPHLTSATTSRSGCGARTSTRPRSSAAVHEALELVHLTGYEKRRRTS
jgi:ABC-type Fe3+/spermidine/putrescine transport system ATPase subunit